MSYSETITRADLTNILNQVLTASSGMSVEDISDKITFGSAWSNLHRQAYLIGGKFVFFTLEGYAGTIVAGTQYTIATIASGYRPKDTVVFTGHATNSSYVPQSVVNCYVWASGDITIRCSNANGNYVFINGWYALAEGSAPIIVADYIVEQGTSGDWGYRKWNSGVAECWRIVTANVTSYPAWGNQYYSFPYGTATFPTDLFVATPVVNAVRTGGPEGSTVVGGITKTGITQLYIIRPNAGATGTLYFSIHAIGKWK